jgi:hypothetical protein
MKAITKPINFELPISKDIIDTSRRSGMTTRFIGNLHVKGTAKHYPDEPDPDDRYTFELSEVNWNGMDLLPLFEAHYFEDIMAHVSGACFKHCIYMFERQEEPLEKKPDSLFEQVANLCRITNHINYGTPL